MILLISTEKNTHFSVAIGDKDGIEKAKTVRKAFRQSELLLEEVKTLVGRKKVDGIIAVNGPGDFSALRIGLATANTLSYGWGVPVVGVKMEAEWSELTENKKLKEIWAVGLESLKKYKPTNKLQFVVPEYGREPNIG